MNIILSGMDSAGKTTFGERVAKEFNMEVIHSTAKTPNTLEYHLDLIDYHDNTVFDRWAVGEMVFPKIYGREAKLTHDEFYKCLDRVKDNNDMYVVFTCSNPQVLVDRLTERGELDYLKEIEQQRVLYQEVAQDMKYHFKGYKNFYICDVGEGYIGNCEDYEEGNNPYKKLDEWFYDHFGKDTVNTAYRKLCKALYEKGHVMETKNIRGGTKELCNYLFTINDLDSEYVSLKTGKSNLTYLAAELLWYWSSRNDTDFISKFGSMWAKLSDDGKTNNSAYGYILQKKHGFNQIEKIIELLKFDPYSRRAVLNINVPNENVVHTKDEPCTVCLDYQIRGGKLHCTTVMRSNDVNFGLRNDLGFFIYLQKYIAKRLGVPVGDYNHFAMSIHFYDRDLKFIKDIAYGDLDQIDEVLDIEKLIDNQDELISWVDNNFTSKEDFEKLLRSKNIIKAKED